MANATRGKINLESNSSGTKTKKSRKQSQTKLDLCKDCEITMEDDTKALTCSFCHKWVCTQCLDIPDELYLGFI